MRTKICGFSLIDVMLVVGISMIIVGICLPLMTKHAKEVGVGQKTNDSIEITVASSWSSIVLIKTVAVDGHKYVVATHGETGVAICPAVDDNKLENVK